MYRTVRLHELPLSEIQSLRLESQKQGHRFIARFVTEYKDGTNRFALPGEALFGVYDDERLIAIGGLNRDPFLENDSVVNDGVGRVRHVYVLTEFRRQGVGTLLLESISRRDYPVVQGCILVIAFSYVIVNTVTDCLYRAVDPRVKL